MSAYKREIYGKYFSTELNLSVFVIFNVKCKFPEYIQLYILL